LLTIVFLFRQAPTTATPAPVPKYAFYPQDNGDYGGYGDGDGDKYGGSDQEQQQQQQPQQQQQRGLGGVSSTSLQALATRAMSKLATAARPGLVRFHAASRRLEEAMDRGNDYYDQALMPYADKGYKGDQYYIRGQVHAVHY
jgi:hypothetical protein